MIFLRPVFPYFNTFHILDRHRFGFVRLRLIRLRFVGLWFVWLWFVGLRFVGLISLGCCSIVRWVLIFIGKGSLDPDTTGIGIETIICHKIIHCSAGIGRGIKNSENAAPGIDRDLCAVFDLLKFCACFHFPFQCRDPRSAVP